MLALSLRPTFINDRPLANDFAVIWTSDSYATQQVGEERLERQRQQRADVWRDDK